MQFVLEFWLSLFELVDSPKPKYSYVSNACEMFDKLAKFSWAFYLTVRALEDMEGLQQTRLSIYFILSFGVGGEALIGHFFLNNHNS